MIYQSPANNLSIIPAGEVDPLTMEALGRGDLQTHIDDLKSRYDFIIIDSAPVLPVADTLLITPHVDAVILSVLLDVSRIPGVEAAYDASRGLRSRSSERSSPGHSRQHITDWIITIPTPHRNPADTVETA